jgi:hypothetical protein
MNAAAPRTQLSLSARLLIALTLVIVGAAAATWALARYDRAAQLLGVASVPAAVQPQPRQALAAPVQQLPQAPAAAVPADRLAELEARLARVENSSRRVEGSAGRADALVIAFAARRAIDRGVPLGYLENLLVDRFGVRHPQAVATIVTSSREPVRLDQLIAEYETLAPVLRGGGRNEGWIEGLRRELASMVEIRRGDRPSVRPDARYRRAQAQLRSGDVNSALAETMRLPGSTEAGAWIAKARRYVAAHRALDQIESAALLGGGSAANR